MKTSYSKLFTSAEIRARSPAWLKFINNFDRSNLAARRVNQQPEKEIIKCQN